MYTSAPLQYLDDISAWLSSVQDQGRLPEVIVNTAARMMQARASSLLLIDESGEKLRFEVTTGPKKREIKNHELEIGQGIAGHVAETGTPLLVKDVTRDTRWYKPITDKIHFSVKSIACSPIKIKSEIVGVLQIIDRKDGGTFENEDLEILNVFANVCAKAIHHARKIENTRILNRELTGRAAEKFRIVGSSPEVKNAVSDALKVANTQASVMLLGESGTGKELMAWMIHRQSDRSDKPMVVLNCGALTESLLEDELFGHEKGAFTGATGLKKGKCELAHKGTLFLDEIGEMSLNMQTRLLRVLQEGTYYRLGGSTMVSVDFRVICATNRDIKRAVQENQFREDLYYRLNVVQIHMPPLRDRRPDIMTLAGHFLEGFKKEQARPELDFSGPVCQLLESHTWPGNIRELKNAIERAVIMSDGPLIVPEDLPFGIDRSRQTPYAQMNLKEAVLEFKKEFVVNTLRSVGGNRSRAARILKIQRTYLSRLISDLGITGI